MWLIRQPDLACLHQKAILRGCQRIRMQFFSMAQQVRLRSGHVLTGWPLLRNYSSTICLCYCRGAMPLDMPNASVLPALSMQEATILAQSAALAIGVDTGLTHIAAAYETPTIEIYCASPKWKTEGNWSDKIINLGDQGTPPTVDEVIGAIKQLRTPR